MGTNNTSEQEIYGGPDVTEGGVRGNPPRAIKIVLPSTARFMASTSAINVFLLTGTLIMRMPKYLSTPTEKKTPEISDEKTKQQPQQQQFYFAKLALQEGREGREREEGGGEGRRISKSRKHTRPPCQKLRGWSQARPYWAP